jgi:hypothetical protein
MKGRGFRPGLFLLRVVEMQIPRAIGVLAVCAIAWPRPVAAQTSGQVWGTVALNWLKTDRTAGESFSIP